MLKAVAQITLALVALAAAVVVCCVVAVGQASKLMWELAVEFLRAARQTELRDFFRWKRALTMALALSLLCGCAGRGGPSSNGIPNFAQVDATHYRGGQPTAAGFTSLRALHVATVFDLRNDPVPFEPEECARHSLRSVNLPMPGGGVLAPNARQLRELVTKIEAVPGIKFIHCEWGCERTGAYYAALRVWRDGWLPERALDEAKAYGMSRAYAIQLRPALIELHAQRERRQELKHTLEQLTP